MPLPPNDSPIHPQLCPLCAASNMCGVARGETRCWCFDAVISADVLARIPADARNLACLCERCARKSR